MIKVADLMLNQDFGFTSKEHILREIGEKYKKRLSEKPNFWHREVESIKMDFTLIPDHDNRLAFWLIRKNDNLNVQCFVFKYQYSVKWQFILSEEVKLKAYNEEIYNVERAEKDISKALEKFLSMQCKNNAKDRECVASEDVIEVDYYSQLLDMKDAKQGQLAKVRLSKGYAFAGYYIKDGDSWMFEGDLD